MADEALNKRSLASDAFGRLVQVIEDPTTLAYSTVYNYCLGNLVGVSQTGATGTAQTSSACAGTNTPGASGSTGVGRSFSYSSLGRLLTAANPESGSIGHTYDANGNLIKRTDARSIITCFGVLAGSACDGSGYDFLNRATRKVYSDGTTSGTTFTYDDPSVPCSRGRLTKATTDQVGSLASVIRSITSYNCVGRITAVSQQVGSNPARTVTGIVYNFAGGMTQEVLPSGRTVSYGYDGAGRASSVTGVINGNSTPYAAMPTTPANSAYSAAGALQNWSMGNGVSEVTSFNSRLQPVSIAAHSTTGGNAALQLNLYYCGSQLLDCPGNNGNLQEQDIHDPTGLSGTAVETYYYDALNRLCGAAEAATAGGAVACSSPLSGNNWQQNYVYDAFGNRALLAGGYGTTGNKQAQVASISTSAVAGIFANNRWSGATPDAGGNVTTLYAGGPQAAYDGENRISSMTEALMPGISYQYDGEGRRVLKTVGTATTEYVYGAAGELVSEYGSAQPPTAGTIYLTADHLGSTRMVTNASGTVTELRDYAPFGEELGAGVGPRPTGSTLYTGLAYPSVTADANKVNFTSKERDAESGLDYFGARYISSAQGRFTSPDPKLVPHDIADPQSWNKYDYTRNNPLRYTDPDGEDWQDALKGGLNAFFSDNAFGAGRINSGNNDFRTGQAIGDAVATIQGTAELLFGGAEAVITAPAALTVAGAVIPAAGVVTAVHGSAVAAVAGSHLAGAAFASAQDDAPTSSGKPSLSDHKDALGKVHDEVGKLPKGEPGKFGSPQAGDSKKGYRLDPAHPNAEPGDPEAQTHINWWDFTKGKKNSGGRKDAVPVGPPGSEQQ